MGGSEGTVTLRMRITPVKQVVPDLWVCILSDDDVRVEQRLLGNLKIKMVRIAG